MFYYLNADGTTEPTDRDTWAKQFSDAECRRIAQDEFWGILVSTIFLGLDHNLGGGKPHIFETLIQGGDFDGEMRRYTTKSEALEGHQHIVWSIKSGRYPFRAETGALSADELKAAGEAARKFLESL